MNSSTDSILYHGKTTYRKVVEECAQPVDLQTRWSERNHQGLGSRLIIPDEDHAGNRGAIRRRERLGGMLNYYYRQVD